MTMHLADHLLNQWINLKLMNLHSYYLHNLKKSKNKSKINIMTKIQRIRKLVIQENPSEFYICLC